MNRIRKEILSQFSISLSMLNRVILTAPHRYKVFLIPKKKPGDFREVAQPAYEVKALQNWLVGFLQGHLPLHDATVAYRAQRGIRYNATQHRKNRFLLKMDLRNFFPSVKQTDFYSHFEKYCDLDLEPADYEDISRIALWQKKSGEPRCLCIGAPSSPFFSNTIPYDLDCAISDFCDELNVKFTRYADDLAFSTNKPDVLRHVEEKVIDLVSQTKYPKLSVNTEKTKHTSRGRGIKLTGVTITQDNNLSIGRERKRTIRAILHRFENNLLNREEKLKLVGLIAFANDIEPSFINRVKAKHGDDIVDKIRDSLSGD